MIITCPHCQTRYQVAYEAIGAAGRKVQCAHCQRAWSQKPIEADPAVQNLNEDILDEALLTEERRVAAELADKTAAAEAALAEGKAPARIDPALARKQQRAFSRRQHAMASRLPLARMRRLARWAGVLTLLGLAAGGYFGRVQVVEQFPAMAGLYAAVGLPVNVLGLQFDKVTTLRTLRDGQDVLIVGAEIVGLQKVPVVVPAVVVTLLDAKGNGIYEWSVTPDIRDLMAGERASFDAQLSLPPGDAARVRLSFTGGGSGRGALPAQTASVEKQ